MLRYPSVIQMDGMALSPGMFVYGRLVSEAFDAPVLMLIQTCLESTCFLANEHFTTGAWHFIDSVRLLLNREGSLTFVRREWRVGPDLNAALMLTYPPDPLTNASYVREVDSRWPPLLPFRAVLPRRPVCRGKMDEGVRITIPH